MEEIRRKKLELIFWHLNDIGRFLEAKSLLPEAIDRLSYFVTYGMISTYVIDEATQMPILKDVQRVTPKETIEKFAPEVIGQAPIHIFPFLQSDALIHPRVADVIKRTNNATYSPAQDCVFLNLESLETERFMATSLLHEMGHGLLRLEEELKMWIFDCRLAQALGGVKLKREIGKTIADITRPGLAGTTKGFRPGIGKPLDLCYRSVSGKEERGGRDKLYWTFCQILAAQQRMDPIRSRQRLLEIMGVICKEHYASEEKLVPSS